MKSWKNWKWKNGTTNCKNEEECDITSSLFTEPVSPLFKLKVHYFVEIWKTGNYYSFMLIKRKGVFTQIGEAKKLFSLPKTIKLLSI